jgi:hypothetical protein
MSEVKLAEDRPRNFKWSYKTYAVSIDFQWQEPGKTPSGVLVKVEDVAAEKFMGTPSSIPRTWKSFEEAVEAGKDFARGLIDHKPLSE